MSRSTLESFFNNYKTPRTQSLSSEFLNKYLISLDIRREDEIHPYVSGNKFRKLKYNFIEALDQRASKIVTFGGAYSNHIVATAALGKIANIPTVAMVRGKELEIKLDEVLKTNATLSFAKSQGMEFSFVTREVYKQKDTRVFQENLKQDFGQDIYCIAQGGTNYLAVKGCQEILTDMDKENYDYIVCPVGTGGTLAGIINASDASQFVLGVAVVKDSSLESTIQQYTNKNNWTLFSDYELVKYAKTNTELISFLNNFWLKFNIPLDPLYTGKAMYVIFNEIKNKRIPENSRILFLHTGGLQAISGINVKLKRQNNNLLKYIPPYFNGITNS